VYVYSREAAGRSSGRMRRKTTVRRSSFMFSGDYPGSRQHRRTKVPYHLLNVLTSSASPSSVSHDRPQPVLHFRTLPADEYWTSSRDPVLPSTTASSGRHPILQSTAVLTLIVVASLSLIVGAIYMLIYFKSIKPMSARSRNYMQATASGAIVGGGGGGKPTDDDGGRARSTHPIFRRS